MSPTAPVNFNDMAANVLSHFKRVGFDDIFKPPMFISPIELSVFRQDIGELDSFVKKEALKFLNCRDENKCWISKPKEFFVPKDSYTFRRVSWFVPLDALKYTLLVCSIGDQIESKRIPKINNVIHSYRYALTDKQLFAPEFGYASFRDASRGKTSEYIGGFKLITDISNFYDRISIHAVENILRDAGCDPQSSLFLNRLLLFFSNQNSFGLPVGGDASRILAEAALINVDNELTREGIDFIRYVDDYRIFARSRAKIYSAMLFLTQHLYKEGLFINFAKTQIIEITQDAREPDEEGKLMLDGHESIGDKKTEASIRKVASISGRTRVSRYYRKPGIEAINALARIDIDKLIKSFPSLNGAEQEKAIRNAVKYYLYVDKKAEIVRYAVLCINLTKGYLPDVARL